MEHLPLPDGAKHFIHVPYYCPNGESDWYDGKGHEGYPARMGWSKQDLLGNAPPGQGGSHFGVNANGTARHFADIERFFHTWLFFGTVIEFLKAGNVPALSGITTASFLCPKGLSTARVVTTEKLPSLLLLWYKSTVEIESLWTRTTAILERTVFYLNRFCQEAKEIHPSDHRKPLRWPVRDEISTSIIAVVFTLIEASKHKCDKIAEGFPVRILGRSAILYKRLERKWCLADATRLEDDLSIDGHYYLAASSGLEEDELDKHYNCTRDRCHYEFDQKMYVTKHAPPPWHHAGCETAVWGGQFGGLLRHQPGGIAKDWEDSVVKIIKAGAVPIVLWSVSEQKFFTVEFYPDGKLKPDFVAISHVWADGKGNPNANMLPKCQIENIQDMVEKIRYEGRRSAVASPYSDGIGFWMDTMCIPVSEQYDELRKKAIKSMGSVYKMAACVLLIDEWIRQIPSTAPAPVILARMYQSNWIKRLWTHQEGFFPKHVYVQFSDRAVDLETFVNVRVDYEKAMAAKGSYLCFPANFALPITDQYSMFKFFYNDITGQKGKLWMLYGPLTDIMRARQTTRLGDEAVCLATILNLNLDPYLAIKDKPDADAARRRMEIFVKDINKFEMGLIFNNWERLKIPGLTWSPKSLLAHRSSSYDTEKGVWDHRCVEIQRDEDGKVEGLPVQYPGFSPFNFTEATRMSISCADRAFAVEVQLHDPEETNPTFIVEVYQNDIVWDQDTLYAVILSKSPEPDTEESVLAVMGAAFPGAADDIEFSHLCLARVRLLKDESPEWIDTVMAAPLQEETKWLVS